MKKSLVASLLVFVLCLSSLTSGIANATPLEKSEEDFKIINESAEGVEYTYEEDGQSYKVIMKYNFDKSEIHNDVYVKNEDGKYEFARTSELIVKDDSALLTITEGEEVKKINVGNEKLNAQKELIIENENLSLFTASNYAQLGPWQYSFTTNIRQDIKGMTRDAIVSTIVGIYYWKVGAAIAAVSIIMGAVSDAFWIKEDTWYKRISGTTIPKGEWTVTKFYADKAHKHFLAGPENHIVYVKGWEP